MLEVGAVGLLQERMAIPVTEACQLKKVLFRMFRGQGLGVRSVCCMGSSFLVGPEDVQPADHPRWDPQQFISVVIAHPALEPVVASAIQVLSVSLTQVSLAAISATTQ